MSSPDGQGEMTPGSTVAFTVKELLAEQTALLRTIDSKVDSKVDKADLVPIVLRLDSHEVQLSDVRQASVVSRAVATADRERSSERKLTVHQRILAVCAGLGVTGSLAASLIAAFHH